MSGSTGQISRLYRALDDVYRFCSRGSAILGGIAMFSMMLLITVDVLSRKVGIASYVGDEVSGYLLVGLVFLGLVHTQRQGKHVQITAVTDTFAPSLKRPLDIGNLVVSIVLVGWMAWYSVLATVEHYTGSVTSLSLLQFPLWIVWVQIPVGLGMFFIGLVASLISTLISVRAAEDAKTPDYQGL